LRIDDLRTGAALIRERYLGKPVGKSNVAIAELYLEGDVSFCADATSKGGSKSPIPEIPKPKSAGGQFEPAIDSRTQRVMNTNIEYPFPPEL
jgi:hypothetical protein